MLGYYNVGGRSVRSHVDVPLLCNKIIRCIGREEYYRLDRDIIRDVYLFCNSYRGASKTFFVVAIVFLEYQESYNVIQILRVRDDFNTRKF